MSHTPCHQSFRRQVVNARTVSPGQGRGGSHALQRDTSHDDRLLSEDALADPEAS